MKKRLRKKLEKRHAAASDRFAKVFVQAMFDSLARRDKLIRQAFRVTDSVERLTTLTLETKP